MRSDRKSRKKAKQERNNLKLWAEGAREEIILKPHVEGYADALSRGARAERDYFARVCTEYHARISWRLLDHEEPPLPLPDYEVKATLAEEDLSDEEREFKLRRVETLNERIRRWLKYRARKLSKSLLSKSTDAASPFASLMGKLAGHEPPPKARQAYQQYQRERAEDLRILVKNEWAQNAVDKDGAAATKPPNAPFRARVARAAFQKLSKAEQDGYAARAKAEASEKKEAYQKALKDGPLKTPEFRQQCIDNLGGFLTGIMQGVADYTGLQALVLLGGPMPRFNGEIGTVHLAVGRNRGPMPVAFPAWDKERFQRDVCGFMKEYLETAYTPEDCWEAKLPDSKSLPDGLLTISSKSEPSESGSDEDSSSSDSGSDDEDEEDGDEDEPVTAKAKGKGKEKERVEKERVEKKKRLRGDVEGEGEGSAPKKTKTTPAAPVTTPAPRPLPLHKQRELAMKRNQEILRQLDLARGGANMIAEGESENASVPKARRAAPKAVPATDRVTRSANPVQAGGGGGLRRLLEESAQRRAQETGGSAVADEGEGPSAEEMMEMMDDPMADVEPALPPVAETSTPPPPVEPAPAPSSPPQPQQSPPVAPFPSSLPQSPPLEPAPPPSTPRLSPPVEPAPPPSTARQPPPVEPAPPSSTAPPYSALDTSVECPETAPSWFRDVFKNISEVQLGPKYDFLLRAFVSLEAAYGFRSKGRIPSERRPQQVGEWIKRARNTPPMEITDIAAFQTEWWAWWKGMQPPWRVSGALSQQGTTDDWGFLVSPGVNGVLSVVATLYWWGCAEKKDGGANSREWEEAVEDVEAALYGLKAAARM